MGEAGHAQQTIRFGVFEVDLHSGELRKAGVRIKLQEQPFKVLIALLERPGEVVTREELRRRIWPHESSGDFDHAVNIAVAKLRTALGDSADAPHLIETLHRRGYRFIFPLSGNGSRAQVPSVALRHPTGNEAGTSEAEANVVISDRGRTPDSIFGISAGFRWSRSISVFGLILVVGGTIAWFIRPLPPPRVISTTQLTHDGLTKTGLLTDGSRLYITETTGSNQFLVQTSAAGGESTVIPTPFESIVTSDISPDHSQMLVADAVGPQYEFPVWVLPLPGGSPRRLGDVVARCDTWSSQGWATWSPDGRQLAFAKGSDIYLANGDGSNPKKLISLSGYASEIRFSPDGTHLRFTLRHFQNNRSAWIFDVRVDGNDLHPLLPGWKTSFSHMAGDWSRDGRYYFFTFCEPSNGCGIWTIRERHEFFSRQPSSPIQLTNGPMSLYFNAISPDGRRIFAGGWTARSEIVRYDPGSHQFVPFLGGISASELDFSRDGMWVAYVSDPNSTLWRSHVDGSERRQLTSAASWVLMPRWSPDGTQIAFVDDQTGPLWKMFLISAQGGTPQEVLAENEHQMDPNWSPDGRQLVFGRVPWLKGSGEKIAIQTFDLDSKKLSIIPGSENLFAPRWSPDGKYLAALSVTGKKLLLYDFKTQKWSDWVSESGDIEHPEWSRDGKYIYYNSTSTKNPTYRRVKLGQTRSEFLIDLKDLHRGGTDPAAAALGPWSALAPDGSALFGRDLSSDEAYSLEVELP
jgi:Tol biopolymer transport system component/DNA-binding winged helix-turn-helix (wHTH) protein